MTVSYYSFDKFFQSILPIKTLQISDIFYMFLN